MSTTHLDSPDRFPPPHRAPGSFDELTGGPPEDGAIAGGQAGQGRYERAMDGRTATGIRKQTRHWLRQ